MLPWENKKEDFHHLPRCHQYLIGSLCEEPENFTLRDALALPLHPSNPIVDLTMTYMVFSDKRPSLADSESQFRGFGWSDNG